MQGLEEVIFSTESRGSLASVMEESVKDKRGLDVAQLEFRAYTGGESYRHGIL